MSAATTTTTVVTEIPQWVKDAPRQDGKLIIVTGATAGIGYQTAKFLAERGATVVLAARNEEKTKAVIDQILVETPTVKREQLVFIKLDLSLMSSVRKFVEEFNASGLVEKHGGLNTLVNNAGGMFSKETTAEGHDFMMASNDLGHFLLTNLLLQTALAPPNTPATVPVRIVNVSSEAHKYSRSINLDKLTSNDDINYPWSKAYNISFARHLAKRLTDDGRTNITSYSLHPGVVRTEFLRDQWWIVKKVVGLFSITSDDGAKTQFYLATAPGVEKDNGKYFDKCAVAKVYGWSSDESVDAKLWDLSAKWTKL
ncbi:NAD(P)-binding protein [Ramicandelaber brevisporus]|nr:NAD(P)-binding protein [Ramicandelaber brevisporus]